MKLHEAVTNLKALKAFTKFLTASKTLHGGIYSYEKTIYTNSRTKVIITCPIHGDFEQTPSNHYKYGCKKCADKKLISRSSNTIDFIAKASNVHKGKYKYTKANYGKATVKVVITCPEHGDFKQQPNNHLSGQGCPTCKLSNISVKQRMSFEGFCVKAGKLHNNLYKYYKHSYTKASNDVSILCNKHGLFTQRASHHLQGSGCPTCAVENSDTGIDLTLPCILYYLEINNGEAYKIGITTRSVTSRYTATDLKLINTLYEYTFSTGVEALAVEQAILRHKTYLGYIGNPLLSSGNTELFKYNIIDLVKCYISKY